MHISEINTYPIKSLKGITVRSALVEDRGLRHDRRWMLTDRAGQFMTQREFPRMATIAVEVTDGGLRVTSENEGEIEIPFEPDKGERRSVAIWQSVCDAEVYRGAVSEWFSDVLRTKCQLVFMPDSSRRSVSKLFNQNDDIVSFADGYPMLVIGEASLKDLNERVAENADEGVCVPLPMNRFRPNFVVSGSEAYAEDKWVRIRVAEAEFRATKPCARCVITTIEQTYGEFDGKEPLKTLASYRLARQVIPERYESLGMNATSVLFGQNLIPETPGATVNIGDTVTLLSGSG